MSDCAAPALSDRRHCLYINTFAFVMTGKKAKGAVIGQRVKTPFGYGFLDAKTPEVGTSRLVPSGIQQPLTNA